jgi:hypothetical protein
MRSIPDPGFAGDDGAADPTLAAALAAYDTAPEGRHHETLALLQQTRVLVPVVAVLGEVAYDDQGLAHDKTSDMATVLMTAADGSRGMLAFTGSAPLQRWNPEARPVPVSVPTAAQAAVQDGADALLVDLAGPVLFVVEGEDLRSLADGQVLTRVGERWAWLRP